jgi:hypothetical protein
LPTQYTSSETSTLKKPSRPKRKIKARTKTTIATKNEEYHGSVIAPGWTTSGALHVYDFGKQSVSFVAAANSVIVLNFCSGEHRDQLVLNQHRYFIGGGSYDWYWLFDRDGRKEIGPVGDDSEKLESIIEKARDIICAPP